MSMQVVKGFTLLLAARPTWDAGFQVLKCTGIVNIDTVHYATLHCCTIITYTDTRND